MNEYKVWYYKGSESREIDWLIVKAEAFHVLDGNLIFYNRIGVTLQNTQAFALGEWMHVLIIPE